MAPILSSRRVALFAGLLAAGLWPLQADDYPVLVYPCPKAAAPPQIDGRLDDACWANAPVVSGFTFYNKQVLAPVQTSFRVVYDDKRLYFAVRCEEPLMKQVAPQPTMRDAMSVFHQECIEIFVDPDHTHKLYYQFAFCIAGAFYDSKLTDPAWNSRAKLAVQQEPDAWTLEVATPWSDMKVAPRPGKVVGFNVCRDRLVANSREWTNWSQTQANFHDPDRFAHLVLSATDKVVASLADEFRKGGRRGPIRIFAPGGYSQTAYIELARQTLAKLDLSLAELERIAREEKSLAARRAIEARIAQARAKLAPTRQALENRGGIDAAQWYRLSRDLDTLKQSLADMVWEARLSALLNSL